jgi:hypothetical protein
MRGHRARIRIVDPPNGRLSQSKRSAVKSPAALPSPLELPPPKLARGKSLPDALRRRRTTREIGSKGVSPQVLSNLLWAACGVNRRKGPFGSPGITAASASNSQEIDVYVALKQGVYLFNALHHELVPMLAGDVRFLGHNRGQVNLAPNAPVQLIYVVDIDRLAHTSGFQEAGLQDAEVQKSYYYADTGLIAGNVYLFSASQGLACWFHNCDKATLAKKLRLRPDQRVLFCQTVGYTS